MFSTLNRKYIVKRYLVMVSLLLVMSSVFSLAHASQHLFHPVDKACDIFLSSDKNSAIDSQLCAPALRFTLHAQQSEISYPYISDKTPTAFLSRAPPAC